MGQYWNAIQRSADSITGARAAALTALKSGKIADAEIELLTIRDNAKLIADIAKAKSKAKEQVAKKLAPKLAKFDR